MQRIGIFSGTFDPIHVGHVEACLVAKGALELDEVLVFVEKKPQHKSHVADYKDRLKMAKLALKDFQTINAIDHKFDNVTFENTKAYLEKSYSNAECVLIVGSDMIDHLKNWQDISEILSNMQLCVFFARKKRAKSC